MFCMNAIVCISFLVFWSSATLTLYTEMIPGFDFIELICPYIRIEAKEAYLLFLS